MTCTHGKTADEGCCTCDRQYHRTGHTSVDLCDHDTVVHAERLGRDLDRDCWGDVDAVTEVFIYGQAPDGWDGHYDESGY